MPSSERSIGPGGERLAFTVAEAAALIGISRSLMYRVVASGDIGTVRIGKCRRVTRRQLDEYLKRSENAEG